MKLSNLFKGDPVIWVIYFFLCAISLIEVFSAGSQLSFKGASFWVPLERQATFLAMGTLLMIIVHNIPPRFFKVIPIFMLPLSIVLLILAMFIGSVNDGGRWLPLPFGLSFQPSELAKGAVVVGVALILAQLQRKDGAERHAMKYILIVTAVTGLLIIPENFSTAALLFLVVYLMMFIGRIPWQQMLKLTGILFLVGVAAIAFILLPPEDSAIYKTSVTHRAITWRHRLETHSARPDSAKDFDYINHRQEAHANLAIVTSNYVGKMPGNSVQRDFLSLAYADFIYAIVIEEMGLWGGFFVIFLYIVLFFRAGRIASRCERNFPAFLAMGLALLLVVQAIVNMFVATGIFPVTGQPLPLISRGGTSTLVTCLYFGMILSVSRYARQTTEQNDPFEKKRSAPQKAVVEDRKEPLPETKEETSVSIDL
ncbi:MAG: FtsW/RodA/SpoVE family cell cycle protein [Alloprevotella sp.]|nr:FtsW/RodA/SpoVE family cell cycle protein [Alloprevotella sp.]